MNTNDGVRTESQAQGAIGRDTVRLSRRSILKGAGVLSVIWLIGSYALLFGILTLALSFRLRGARATLGRQATGVA